MTMVARAAFLEALNDAALVIHIQAQKPTSLDSAVLVSQHMEVVLHSAGGRAVRPVRTVVREPEAVKADGGTKVALAKKSEPDAERLAGIDKENSGDE